MVIESSSFILHHLKFYVFDFLEIHLEKMQVVIKFRNLLLFDGDDY